MSFISSDSSNGSFVVHTEGSSLDDAQEASTNALLATFAQSEANKDVINGPISYKIKGKVRVLGRIPSGFMVKGTADQLTKLYDKLSRYRSLDSLGRAEMIVRHIVAKSDTVRYRRPFKEEELKEDGAEEHGTLRMNFKDYKHVRKIRRVQSVFLNSQKLSEELGALDSSKGQEKAFTNVGIEVKAVDVVVKRAVPKFKAQEDAPLDATKLKDFNPSSEAEDDEETYEGGSVVFNGRVIRTTEDDSSSDFESSDSVSSVATTKESEEFNFSQDELDLLAESLECFLLTTSEQPKSRPKEDLPRSKATLGDRQLRAITHEPANATTPLLKTAKKTGSFASNLFGFFSRITSVVVNVARFFFAPLIKLTAFVR